MRQAKRWERDVLGILQDEKTLVQLIERHRELTGSALAARLLADWQQVKPHFVKVFPLEYRKALEVRLGSLLRARFFFCLAV